MFQYNCVEHTWNFFSFLKLKIYGELKYVDVKSLEVLYQLISLIRNIFQRDNYGNTKFKIFIQYGKK